MSGGPNDGGLFIDTGLLRDHVSKLREQKKTALRLKHSVEKVKMLSDPSMSFQYDPIIRDVESLVEYLDRMADALDQVDDEAIMASMRIASLIDSSTEETLHIVSNEIKL